MKSITKHFFIFLKNTFLNFTKNLNENIFPTINCLYYTYNNENFANF